MASHISLQTRSGISFMDFEKEIDGKKSKLFVLSNKKGVEVAITNFGLRLVSMLVPDKNGKFVDVVLGYKTIEEYQNPNNEYYFGAVVGRYANRIANAKFLLEGKEYHLEKNNGENHLHGGSEGFHRVVWDSNRISESEIAFSYFSKDMEQGYPGNLRISVNYKITQSNELEISYSANSDKRTIVNLTHHSYFNLTGEGINILDDHLFKINADYFTPINKDSIPTGKQTLVKDSPFDFRKQKLIKSDIQADDIQLIHGNGYDHNFVLNDKPTNAEGLVLAAQVKQLSNKIAMNVYTDKPGIQFYTANFLDGTSKGKNDLPHHKRTGFCLESQYFPDSPNKPEFPSAILNSDETYQSKSVYQFYITEE